MRETLMRPIILLGLLPTLISCGDECVTCSRQNDIMEICDSKDLNFTDQNGNPSTYEGVIAEAEQGGWDCR